MSGIGLTYPDKDPCSRAATRIQVVGNDLTALKSALESRGDTLNGCGDLSVQTMDQIGTMERGGVRAADGSTSAPAFPCHNGGPKTDSEWYDPNTGQQVTAHCVIL